MLFAVNNFYVIEKQIGVGKYSFKIRKGNVPCGIHGGMYAVFFAHLQNLGEKINLKHTFTTREGHAAPGALIKRFILHDLTHDFVYGVFLAAYFSCIARTVERTLATQIALF